MAASGVCHSCLHAADGSWKGVPVPSCWATRAPAWSRRSGPAWPGLQAGDHVDPLVGAHVRPLPLLRDRPAEPLRAAAARPRRAAGRAPRACRSRGRPVYHYGHVATYASRPSWTSRARSRSTSDMPLDRAALIGCSVMTGVGAVINTAAVPPGASMAVFGVGGVGLNVVQGGALVAAHPIIAVDVKAAQARARARARAPATASTPRARTRWRPSAASRGRGADYTFVAVGDTRAVTQASTRWRRRHLRAHRRARQPARPCRWTCGRW